MPKPGDVLSFYEMCELEGGGTFGFESGSSRSMPVPNRSFEPGTPSRLFVPNLPPDPLKAGRDY